VPRLRKKLHVEMLFHVTLLREDIHNAGLSAIPISQQSLASRSAPFSSQSYTTPCPVTEGGIPLGPLESYMQSAELRPSSAMACLLSFELLINLHY
jgi:hypothetical protein